MMNEIDAAMQDTAKLKNYIAPRYPDLEYDPEKIAREAEEEIQSSRSSRSTKSTNSKPADNHSNPSKGSIHSQTSKSMKQNRLNSNLNSARSTKSNKSAKSTHPTKSGRLGEKKPGELTEFGESLVSERRKPIKSKNKRNSPDITRPELGNHSELGTQPIPRNILQNPVRNTNIRPRTSMARTGFSQTVPTRGKVLVHPK